MNKKLIALAIASALVAPVAMADSGNVKISGYLHLSYDSLKGNSVAGASDNQSMSNVSSNASNIVFSGDEDLGNGLKAVWQVQTFMTMGGTGNADATYADGVSNGVSYLGLNGGFGTVLLGKVDTPMKALGRKVDLFNNQIGDTRNLISAANATGGGNNWDLRVNNTVVYATPNISGFSAVGAYVTNVNAATAYTTTASANSVDATSAQALGVNYENGPVFAGLAYEKHQVAGNNTSPKAYRLAGGYNFGDVKVVALWETTKDNSAAAATDDDRKVWGLGAGYKMGSNTLKAQYYKAQKYGNTDNSGANMWALGVDHALSKRTTAYVAYARTNNENNAAFSAFGGGHGDNPGTVTGKDPAGLSLGMIHTF